MIAITYLVIETIYNRTYNGMDSEFSHTSIEPREYTCIVPNQTETSRKMADDWINSHHKHDKDFEIMNVTTKDVHVIFQSPLTRI